jgi:hypothetical protein
VNRVVIYEETYSTRAPFDSVSSAKAFPIRRDRTGFHVEAEQTAAGKQAALVPPLNTSPRAPFGPSDVYEEVSALVQLGN